MAVRSGRQVFPTLGLATFFFYPSLGVGNIFDVGVEWGNKLRVSPG